MTKKDIKLAIHETLSDFSYRKDLTGWLRGDQTVNSGLLAEEIARLTKENSELRSKLNNLEPNSNALYANLSYSELEGLLKKDLVEIDGKKISLFELLMTHGESLAGEGIKFTAAGDTTAIRAPFEKLRIYKLLVETGEAAYIYTFTGDGHNFYLRAMVKSM